MFKRNKNYFQLMSCLEKAKFNLLFNTKHGETYNCGILLNKDVSNDDFLEFLSEYFVKTPAMTMCCVEEDDSILQSQYYSVVIKKDTVSFDGALALDIILRSAWKNNTDYDVVIDKLRSFKIC